MTRSPDVEVKGKAAHIAGQALELFQSGDVDGGVERLSKAYALVQKTSPDKGPMLSMIAYIGMMNDLGEKAAVNSKAVDLITSRHNQVVGILEEWTWKRRGGNKSITAECHEACTRYCADTDLPPDIRGEKEEIGIPALILKEFGAEVDEPQKTMNAIEKCLMAVGELATLSRRTPQSGMALPGQSQDLGGGVGRNAGR